MKITSLKTQLVDLPLTNPIHTAIHNISSVGCVLLSLETDEGHVGQSYVFTINAVRLKAFDEMIKGFSHQLIVKTHIIPKRFGNRSGMKLTQWATKV